MPASSLWDTAHRSSSLERGATPSFFLFVHHESCLAAHCSPSFLLTLVQLAAFVHWWNQPTGCSIEVQVRSFSIITRILSPSHWLLCDWLLWDLL